MYSVLIYKIKGPEFLLIIQNLSFQFFKQIDYLGFIINLISKKYMAIVQKVEEKGVSKYILPSLSNYGHFGKNTNGLCLLIQIFHK